MKIRGGFVANSSSCTFIFFFDEVPSEEELKEKLFDGANRIPSYYDDRKMIDTHIITRRLYEDLLEGVIEPEKVFDKLVNLVGGGISLPKHGIRYDPYESIYEKGGFNKKWDEMCRAERKGKIPSAMKQYDEVFKEAQNIQAHHDIMITEKICEIFDGKKMSIVTYEDHDDIEGTLHSADYSQFDVIIHSNH